MDNKKDDFINIFIKYYIEDMIVKDIAHNMKLDKRTVSKYIEALEYNIELFAHIQCIDNNRKKFDLDEIKKEILNKAKKIFEYVYKDIVNILANSLEIENTNSIDILEYLQREIDVLNSICSEVMCIHINDINDNLLDLIINEVLWYINFLNFISVDRVSYINNYDKEVDLNIVRKVQYIKNNIGIFDTLGNRKNKLEMKNNILDIYNIYGKHATVIQRFVKFRIDSEDNFYNDVSKLSHNEIKRYLTFIDEIEENGELYNKIYSKKK